jgi:tetratricopeptide (TPR) repeat protein
VELFESGDFKSALFQFEALAQHATDSKEKAGFLLDQANCYTRLGCEEDADRCLAEARKLAGNDRIGLLISELGHACFLLEQNRLAEALGVLDLLRDQNRDLFDETEFLALRRDVQLQRSFVLVQLNRYHEALPDLQEICAAQPDGEAFTLLARCYYELKQYATAEQTFVMAAEHGISDDSRAAFHYYCGRNYYELGNFAKAKQEFMLSAQSGNTTPPRTQVYQMLAATCRLLGGHEDAARYAAMGAA